ncbi:MAG: hypothetical protein ACREMQ_12105 [Longimicrobiales bacterium]
MTPRCAAPAIAGMLAGFFAAAPATAQTNGHVPEVLPGDASIDGTRFKAGTWEIRYMSLKGGSEEETGRMTVELAPVEVEGKPAWRLVHTFRTAQGSGSGTTIVHRQSLAPVSHRGTYVGRTIALDYKGANVTGNITTPSDGTKAIGVNLASPAFDPNAIELLIGSLPLREGYRARLPVFESDKNAVSWYEARVLGRKSVHVEQVDRMAWELEIDFGEGTGKLWIDPETRGMVLASFTDKNGSEMQMRRVYKQ